MHCWNCGQQNDDNAWKCITCGEALKIAEQKPVFPQQSGKAIASFVCSILGIVFCPLLFSIIGLVLGFIAKSEINNSRGNLTGSGFATAGIIIGFIGLGLSLFFGLVVILALLAA